jgi:hypothetical protein
MVAEGVNAAAHQHIFSARLDMAVDDEDGGRGLVVSEVSLCVCVCVCACVLLRSRACVCVCVCEGREQRGWGCLGLMQGPFERWSGIVQGRGRSRRGAVEGFGGAGQPPGGQPLQMTDGNQFDGWLVGFVQGPGCQQAVFVQG